MNLNKLVELNNTKINTHEIKSAAMTLRALNHKLRLQIIKLIDENENIPVTDIYVKLRIEQSVASQHLAILRRANFLIAKREGKFIYYKINKERVTQVSQFVSDLLKD